MAYSACKKGRERGGRVHVMLGEREESAYYCVRLAVQLYASNTLFFFLCGFIVEVKKIFTIQWFFFRSARFDLIAVNSIGHWVRAGGGRSKRRS